MIVNSAEIIQASNIEQVIGECITLKKQGSSLKACCPFHGENTPSFVVNASRGFYKCFGCGASGDAATFIMQHKNLSFPEALKYLAQKAGIEVKEDKEGRVEDYKPLMEARATLVALQAHFVTDKGEKNPGREYFKKRGFDDATMDVFGIGYCEGQPQSITKEALKAAGVANDQGNLSFFRRATIPVHDYRGNLISFAGRALDAQEPKYLNGRTVEKVYEKGKYLFNLNRADKHIREKKEVWITEGYADCMALTQMGTANVIGLCGAELTTEHLQTLKKYNGDKPLRLMLALDNQVALIGKKEGWDEAKKAKAIQDWEAKIWDIVGRLLPLGEVRIVTLPAGCKDAGEVLEKKMPFDKVAHKEAINKFVEDGKANFDKLSPIEQSEFQEKVARMIATVEKETARDIYINSLSGLIHIGTRQLEGLVKKLRGKDRVDQENTQTKEFKFVKVKDEYLQRIPIKDTKSGAITIQYTPRKVAELKEEFGPKFVKEIPRFVNWVLEPAHTDYKRIHELSFEGITYRSFNRYMPAPYAPKEFEVPAAYKADPHGFDIETIPEIKHSAKYLKHLFRSSQELNVALDMIALKWLDPRAKIRSLALVSSEEGTGKSTFIDWMLKIFGQNATKTEVQQMGSNFNSLMSGKIFVGIEETKDEKGSIENRLKDLITGFESVVTRKFQESVVEENFAWYCFASNHEDSFMKVGANTTRFFVVKVHPLQFIDPDFSEKLYREIPYFLHFLAVRGTVYPKTDRLWHDQSLVENEALLKLRQTSKDIVHQNMEELLQSIFIRMEYTKPIIRMNSEYLGSLMKAWGGKVYESKTPNYFFKCATNDLKCYNKDTPTSFECPVIQGILSSDFFTRSSWEYKTEKVKSRYIEFPIWKFCTPMDIITNYAPDKLEELLLNLQTSCADLETRYDAKTILNYYEQIKAPRSFRLPQK
jgi:DNA primase catalytic core